MQYKLADKEPRAVLRYFEEIAAIPHGSRNTKAISDYLVQFAKAHELRYFQDEEGNVVIFADASPGYEEAERIVLQGHMDMVCEKNSDVMLDMETEPIVLVLDDDGDTLRADGTTLGGDDGIAVAMMLAILEDKMLPHPGLDCIFTVDEEVGMDGAEALDCSSIRGRKLLNLDSEEEGVFTAGCAGGVQPHITFPVERKEKSGLPLTVRVSGLRGGHSGECIGLGRANANQILGRTLCALGKEFPFRLIRVDGGSKDNAITREAEAELLFPRGTDRTAVTAWIDGFAELLRNEYQFTDAGISLTGEWGEETARRVMKKKSARAVLSFLAVFPYGVQEFSPVFEGLPQTSLNLGILKTEESAVRAVFLVRSSVNSQKDMMTDRVVSLAEALGGNAELSGRYPAWEYQAQSPFRDLMARLYEEQTGKKPRIAVIHGGLECGLLSGKLPGLDAVSIGPDMKDIHTPNEHFSLRSADRVYQFVLSLLRESR